MVQEARNRGIDVTTEAYPYPRDDRARLAAAGQFVNGPDSMFAKLMLVSTGERLTRASFTANRTPAPW